MCLEEKREREEKREEREERREKRGERREMSEKQPSPSPLGAFAISLVVCLELLALEFCVWAKFELG